MTWISDREWRSLNGRLDAIFGRVHTIEQQQEKIMSALEDLAAAVAAEDQTIDAAVVLLNGIPALIAAAGTDPAKLASLQADIKAETAKLAAAVVVGTPAAATTAAAAAVAGT